VRTAIQRNSMRGPLLKRGSTIQAIAVPDRGDPLVRSQDTVGSTIALFALDDVAMVRPGGCCHWLTSRECRRRVVNDVGSRRVHVVDGPMAACHFIHLRSAHTQSAECNFEQYRNWLRGSTLRQFALVRFIRQIIPLNETSVAAQNSPGAGRSVPIRRQHYRPRPIMIEGPAEMCCAERFPTRCGAWRC